MNAEAQLTEAVNPGWVLIDSGHTSIGARWWTLRKDLTTAFVAELSRGDGIRIMFNTTLVEQLPRAAAHAAKCYAMVCDKVADFASVAALDHRLDVRPVSVSGSSLGVDGAGALTAIAPYFGGLFAVRACSEAM